MDSISEQSFSLTQLSGSSSVVIFEKNNLEIIFDHIKNEPKHGQRIVVLNLDKTLLSQKKTRHTSVFIQPLIAETSN